MRLRVLGNTGQYLAPFSGGSSYVLEHDDTRILLDAGGGARAAVGALAGAEPIHFDAVVISHFHFDHVQDLVTLRDALDRTTTLVIPAGERGRLDALAQAYSFGGGFDLTGPALEAGGVGAPIDVNGVRLTFAGTQHSAPAIATRASVGGRSFVYASDTAPCAALLELARGADLLLMHTLLPRVDPAAHHARVHCTAETAGALAVEAGARRLLLSHRYRESKDEEMLAAASGAAQVELARDGALYSV